MPSTGTRTSFRGSSASGVIPDDRVRDGAGDGAGRAGGVFFCGFSEPEQRELARAVQAILRERTEIVACADLDAALIRGRESFSVLCLGPGLSPTSMALRLGETLEGDGGPPVVVVGAGAEIEAFAPLVEAGRVFFLSAGVPAPGQLASVVAAALERNRLTIGGKVEAHSEWEEQVELARLVHVVERVELQREPDDVAALWQASAGEVVDARRAYLLLYESDREALTGPPVEGDEGRLESAAVGVVSYVLRTGSTVRLDRLDEDPRFERAADDPLGTGGERFLAVPLSAGEEVIAVAVAVRDREDPPFTPRHDRLYSLLAEQVAPALHRLLLRQAVAGGLERGSGVLTESQLRIHRREAVEHYVAGRDDSGAPLALDPRWMRWCVVLLLLVTLGALAAAAFATVTEYAQGVALVWVEGRYEVPATEPATIVSIEVRPGREVAAGDPLVRLRPVGQGATIERILPSPWDGRIADVLVRPGRFVAPGEPVAVVVTGTPRAYVEVLLPGETRPLLRPGTPLRVELRGSDRSLGELAIAEVSDEIVGAAEARERWGGKVVDALDLHGGVVAVRAELPSPAGTSGDGIRLYPGMTGTAEVPLGKRPLLQALLPAARALGGTGG